MGFLVQCRNQTCICWTDDMNIEVVRHVAEEIMIYGGIDKEEVLLHVLHSRPWQISNAFDQTNSGSSIV